MHEITASTIIVCVDRVLLHKHSKHQKWLPVGGHVEPGELMHEAALREVKEEAGLKVSLWNPLPPLPHTNFPQIASPAHALQYPYSPIMTDYIYYARSDTFILNPSNTELVNTLRWFTRDELIWESFDGMTMPSDVRELCCEALTLLGT